jgi:ABC-type oligopeptide transport system substrate-binding subunit
VDRAPPPGTFFADDPAFKGVKRELTAHDFVYTWKRFADPANKSPNWSSVEEHKLVGPGRAAQEGAGREEAL